MSSEACTGHRPTRGGPHQSWRWDGVGETIRFAFHRHRGKLQQAVGDLTDNDDLKNKGKADEKTGDAKELVDKAGEKIDGLIDSAHKALTND